ncbi:hypothetical protein CR513_54490, partial [Mucuna pruriens]
MEAVIPVEIEESSPRTALFQSSDNEEELRANLDLLQEAYEVAQIRECAIKAGGGQATGETFPTRPVRGWPTRLAPGKRQDL